MQRPEIKNNIQQSNGTHGITNYSNTKYGDTKYHNAKYHNLKNYNAEYSSMKQKDIPRSYTQEHTLKSSAIATCPVTPLKSLLLRYRHAWILLYGIFYLACFAYLENTVTKKFHIITMPVDLKIPFCEYFIIPYLLWFAYITFGVMYFFFHQKEDYYKICVFLFTGMTVFLIVSAIYPNGHYLRPLTFERENFCTDLVRWLYQTDTPTNLFPSIHVYNSLGVHIALTHSACFKDKKAVSRTSFVLCVLIILSTMFLKQHSVFDVFTAFGMAAIMYYIVYRQAYKKVLSLLRAGKSEKSPALHDLRL